KTAQRPAQILCVDLHHPFLYRQRIILLTDVRLTDRTRLKLRKPQTYSGCPVFKTTTSETGKVDDSMPSNSEYTK
ncbi:MAG: hypothetical protein KAR37_15655, partial [Alphaproteobacteria bacterium]|nr:hypothetical protein [Alphaproteobacteria bacterium]